MTEAFLKYRLLAIPLLFMILATACRSGRKDMMPAVNPELLNLTKEQVFAKADGFYEERKWTKAREYYGYVYENHPNDPLGRRSLLKIADTYYMQGDPVNLVEAQYKYRDFINRYPGSDFADYAMLQIANVSFKQMESPERDQTKTREAVQKFKEMLAAFPRSNYKPEAEEKLQQALDRLAKHEHVVARFYMKRGQYQAAVTRLNGIVDTYPNYGGRDGMFYDLGVSLEALGRSGEARLYFERVMAEFPKSEYAEKARARLTETKA